MRFESGFRLLFTYGFQKIYPLLAKIRLQKCGTIFMSKISKKITPGILPKFPVFRRMENLARDKGNNITKLQWSNTESCSAFIV